MDRYVLVTTTRMNERRLTPDHPPHLEDFVPASLEAGVYKHHALEIYCSYPTEALSPYESACQAFACLTRVPQEPTRLLLRSGFIALRISCTNGLTLANLSVLIQMKGPIRERMVVK